MLKNVYFNTQHINYGNKIWHYKIKDNESKVKISDTNTNIIKNQFYKEKPLKLYRLEE